MSGVDIGITFLGPLRQQMNCKEEHLLFEPPITVRSILDRLIQEHGEHLTDLFYNTQGWLNPRILFLIDGEGPEARQGLETELTGQEEIQIVMGLSMSGG